MFADRLPSDLRPNRLSAAVGERRQRGLPILDLTASNPTLVEFDYPASMLAPLADARALAYRPHPLGLPAARDAVSHDYARQRVDISPDRVVLTASTSEAYSLLFKLLAGAGDEVLIPRPSYPLFDHLTRLDLVTPRPYDLEYDGRWSIDFDSVERALGPRTRAVLVVNPNNPTGSFVTRGELDRLATLCARRGIAIVADEVFADYELEAGAAAASGRAAQRADVLSFSLGGLSKSAGLPQLKLAWIAVAGPASLAAAALERLEVIADAYLSVSTPVQAAAAELLRAAVAIRNQIAVRVRRNDEQLRARARSTASCRVLRAEGGWSAVVQVPTFEPEEELALRLLGDGVLTHPGYFFDFPRESFLVVSLLPPPVTFAHGVDLVFRHFDCTTAADTHA